MRSLRRYGGWAVVTGASSGLGAAFARRLAADGVPVVLVARREDRLSTLAAALRRDHGVDTLVAPLDLAVPDCAERLVAVVDERPVGVLVNNAGAGRAGAFLDADPATLAAMVAVNATAPVCLTHAFLPQMLERRRGAVVFVASVVAYQATPYLSVYAATKAFDLVLGESLYGELAGTGIDVLTVSPGSTATEFHAVAGFGAGARGGADPDAVVAWGLARLGIVASTVHGVGNNAGIFTTRLLPRTVVARAVARVTRRLAPPLPEADVEPRGSRPA